MGIEIERKFLVKGNDWKDLAKPVLYIQGYLISDEIRTVRIRVAGEKAFITIKGRINGISRKEFEYEIPRNDVDELFSLCENNLVEKRRSKIEWEGKKWEVDEFLGENKGLVLAEIELKSEDETFSIPPWVGKEVTGDLHYYNSWLASHPFTKWK